MLPFLIPLLGGALNRKDLDPKQVDLSQNMLEAKGQSGQAIDNNAAALQNLNAMANNGEQQNVFGQQQALAQQLQAMADGKGPSLANQQLANATGQNVANQAAMMAGQRGAGANVGLMARQAAMQGAGIQQQAAGQGAALRLQEQSNALGQLQQQQGAMGNTAQGIQGARAQAQQGMQGNQNSLLGNMNANNRLILDQQQGINSLNRDAQKQDSDQKFQAVKMGLQAAGSALGAAEGGVVPHKGGSFAEGGAIPYKGSSSIGAMLHGYANGGPVNLDNGGHVPGKAKVAGAVDSYANDTVDAKLSPGEWVIPRSVTQAANPKAEAMRFIDALLAKQGKK
jgi:hypothetical protein